MFIWANGDYRGEERNRVRTTVWIVAAVLVLCSCFTNTHVVGDGGAGGESIQQRHWYVLWGLVEMNKVDSASMADGVEDYTVKTDVSVVDFVINCFTSLVSVECMTTTVTK